MAPAQGRDEFAGSVTLITGGSRGIGRSLALALGSRGGSVVINYKTHAAEAAETLDQVREVGGDGIAVCADMEKPDEIEALFDAAEDRFGHLDHFVCNAAASSFTSIRNIRQHHLDRSFAMNVRPFVLGAQRALDMMPRGGRIVALSSYGSQRAYPGYANLGSAKAAIEAWVRYMAMEFGPAGITVNAVNGGIIDTASSAYFYDVPGMPPLPDVLERIPAGRMGTPDEVAATVLFLLSRGAQYITGHTLVVDGGLSIVAPPFLADATGPLRSAPPAPES